MTFYLFDQNNSGGGFDVDEDIAHRVVIEADSEEAAEEKAFSIGIYYNGCDEGRDCECCGDRWYGCEELDLKDLSKGWEKDFESVENYMQYLADKYGWTNPDCIIHYKDDTKLNIIKGNVI